MTEHSRPARESWTDLGTALATAGVDMPTGPAEVAEYAAELEHTARPGTTPDVSELLERAERADGEHRRDLLAQAVGAITDHHTRRAAITDVGEALRRAAAARYTRAYRAVIADAELESALAARHAEAAERFASAWAGVRAVVGDTRDVTDLAELVRLPLSGPEMSRLAEQHVAASIAAAELDALADVRTHLPAAGLPGARDAAELVQTVQASPAVVGRVLWPVGGPVRGLRWGSVLDLGGTLSWASATVHAERVAEVQEHRRAEAAPRQSRADVFRSEVQERQVERASGVAAGTPFERGERSVGVVHQRDPHPVSGV